MLVGGAPSEGAIASAVPEMFAVHDANGGSNPPAGIVIVKEIDDPLIVPDTVPRPFADVPLSARVTGPVNALPFWVIVHVTVPGPVESVAVPVHVPAMAAGVAPPPLDEGAVLDEDEPPPPPAQPRQTMTAVQTEAATVNRIARRTPLAPPVFTAGTGTEAPAPRRRRRRRGSVRGPRRAGGCR